MIITARLEQPDLPDGGSVEIQIEMPDARVTELMPPSQRDMLNAERARNNAFAVGELNRRLARRESLINAIGAALARKLIETTEGAMKPAAKDEKKKAVA